MSDRASIAWRRLDFPGRESAELCRAAHGWRLSGHVAITVPEQSARLDYTIACDPEWRTLTCSVRGTARESPVSLDVARDPGDHWTANDAPIPDVDGCIDIDLGFSPITNTLPIRRLSLAVSASAAVRAAWVRFPELTIELLEQRYTRLAEYRYLYESAGGTFRRELAVDDSGLVVDYPGLWIAHHEHDT